MGVLKSGKSRSRKSCKKSSSCSWVKAKAGVHKGYCKNKSKRKSSKSKSPKKPRKSSRRKSKKCNMLKSGKSRSKKSCVGDDCEWISGKRGSHKGYCRKKSKKSKKTKKSKK